MQRWSLLFRGSGIATTTAATAAVTAVGGMDTHEISGGAGFVRRIVHLHVHKRRRDIRRDVVTQSNTRRVGEAVSSIEISAQPALAQLSVAFTVFKHTARLWFIAWETAEIKVVGKQHVKGLRHVTVQ